MKNFYGVGQENWELHKLIIERFNDAKFDNNSEQHLENLINKSIPLIKGYTTKKLAKIFSECIEWIGEGPRQDTDWLSAEKYTNFLLEGHGLNELAYKVIILGAYETLPEKSLSKELPLPKENYDVTNRGGTLICLPYKKQMQKLSEEELENHLQEGYEKLPKNMDQFLGRQIFKIYQNTRELKNMYSENYGEIIFY